LCSDGANYRCGGKGVQPPAYGYFFGKRALCLIHRVSINSQASLTQTCAVYKTAYNGMCPAAID